MAGRFRRYANKVANAARRVVGRPAKEVPAPPPAPPAPPTPAPPPAPPAPAEEERPPTPGVPLPLGEEEEEEREYPDEVSVTIAGQWIVSSSRWNGVISGSLSGDEVRSFIDYIEAGNEGEAVKLVAAAYDYMGQGFASGLDVDASSWAAIDWQ